MSSSKSILARNTFWSIAGYAAQFLVPILLIPYTVHQVGLDAYGLWVALFTLATWVSSFDVGIWGSIVRDVADRKARQDRDGLRTLWATWLFFDLACIAVILPAAVFAGPAILSRLVPRADPHLARPVFTGLCGLFALTPLLRHLNYTLNGLQRLDVANLLTLIVTPLWVVAQMAVLRLGWGLLGLMGVGLVFAVIQIVALLALIAREGYPVTFSPFRFSGAELRRMVSFGWKLQAGIFLGQVFRNDRLLVGRMGQERIAIYQFGAAIMDRLAGAVAVLSSAVMPVVSDLLARGDLDRVRIVFLRGTKYHALAAVGLLGFAALFGHELIVFWMGKAHPDSVMILRIMALGSVAAAIGSCGHSVAASLGRPGWTTVCTALGLAATVFLYMTVGRRYDYRGLAACVSLGLTLIQIVFMSGLRRFLEFRWREYVGNALLKPAVLAVPLAGVYAAWSALAPHLPPIDTRARAFAVLAPAFSVFAVLGWFLARKLRVIDDYDVDVLKSPGRRASA